MILGIGFITGGIGVPVTGRLADEIGIQSALASLALLLLAGAVIGWSIPRNALEARQVEREPEMVEMPVTPVEAAPRAAPVGRR
jgi:hypothetical protein